MTANESVIDLLGARVAHTTPGCASSRLTSLIESRAHELTEAQLTALEVLVRGLIQPAFRARRRGASTVRLTPREQDVLVLLCTELTATAIARQLGVSTRTVTKHQENLYRKLGTSNRMATVLMAQRLGLTPGFQEIS